MKILFEMHDMLWNLTAKPHIVLPLNQPCLQTVSVWISRRLHMYIESNGR